MIRLPKVCGPISLACAKNAGNGTDGVQVSEYDGDAYQVAATDKRILAILRGTGTGEPPFPKMLTVANDLWQYIIPADHWQAFFKRLKKDQSLGIAAEKDADDKDKHNIVLADGEISLSISPDHTTFPSILSILPEKPAMLSVGFQPGLLIRLLTIAERIQELAGMEDKEVHILFWGEGKAIGVCFRTQTGECFDGLIMPLAGVNPPPQVEDDEPAPAVEEAAGPDTPTPPAPPTDDTPTSLPEPVRPSPEPEKNGQVEDPAPKPKKARKPWFKKRGGSDGKGK